MTKAVLIVESIPIRLPYAREAGPVTTIYRGSFEFEGPLAREVHESTMRTGKGAHQWIEEALREKLERENTVEAPPS